MTAMEELIKILGVLTALYPRFELNPTTIEAYHAVLGDLPPDLLRAATLEYARRDTPWFPAAGQLRSLAFSLIEHGSGQISAAEAWSEARKVLRDPSLYRPEVRGIREDYFSDPAIYDAIKAIGELDIFMMTEDTLVSTRARFITAFETCLNRRRTSQQMLPEVRRVVRQLCDSDMSPRLEARDDD